MTRIPVQAKAGDSGPPHLRRGLPLTFGVPLARGTARESDGWMIIDANATRRMVQTRVLDRWSDGSVRWLLVDAQVDIGSDGAQLFLEPVSIDAVAPGRPLTISQQLNTAIVDTGAAIFRLGTGTPFPFDSISCQGSRFAEPCRLTVVDGNGGTCETTIRTVDVVEAGPLRASVRLKGDTRRHGAEFLLVECRIDFYAGHGAVRVRVTLINPRRAVHKGGFWDLGDPGSVLLKDVTLSVALPRPSEKLRLRCSPERGVEWQPIEAPFEIFQGSSGGENWKSTAHMNRERRVPLLFRGYRLTCGSTVAHGLRATPIVAADAGTVATAVCLPYFWENFPKAVEVDDRSIAIGLFPRQHADVYEIQGGEQKTHEIFVSFAMDAITDEPLEWCRTPVVVSVDPAWTFSTGAVPFLTPLEQRHASLVAAGVDGPDRFEYKREIADEYGWRHFGDIYGDHEATRYTGPDVLVSHYNNQYDPIAGFAYQFLRTGDVRWWRLMTELASHVIDIDIYHTDRDKTAYNHGLFWHTYHYGDADTSHHRSYPRAARGRTHGGGPSADHNYTTGLTHYHFMTGDEIARETVAALGQFVIDMEDGRRTPFRWLARGETGRATLSAAGYYGPGRAAANSVSALLDAYRLTGEPRFIEKAERLIRRVVHPDQDIRGLRLDVPEQRWFYTMFLQALGKYLHYKVARRELDAMYAYGRASLLHYARWMVTNEHPYLEKPEKLEFPTETWAAQDIRKSDVFYFAALHASGNERERFVDRARFFHDYSTRTLLRSPTRALARPVAILLTSGFMHGFIARQPDMSAPDPSQSDAFGKPERFVPQRERAKRRAVLLAVMAAAVVLTALVLLILR
jgi:exo-rhamnogalacturonan lyase-like protein